MSPRDRYLAAFLLGPQSVEFRELALERPLAGELVVRIDAATTCGTDVKVFRRGGHPRMLIAPCRFGHEMAATVAAVGNGVAGWREGDRVVVANSAPCGSCTFCRRGRANLCSDLLYLNGAYAEFQRIPPRFVRSSTHAVPAGVPAEIAALAEPMACVLHGLDLLDLPEASDVVVFGCGPIGLLFVRLLAAGGHRVTAADPNPERLEVANRFGAAAIVAVEREGGEAVRLRTFAGDPEGFEAAVDAAASPVAWTDVAAAIRRGGKALFFGGCPPGTEVCLDTHRIHYSELELRGVYHHTPATFARAVELLGAKDLGLAALLSADRPLSELEAALRSMMRRQALKVVLRPQP